jgi:hypothetical protein
MRERHSRTGKSRSRVRSGYQESERPRERRVLANWRVQTSQHSEGNSVSEKHSLSSGRRECDKSGKRKKSSDSERGNTHPLENAKARTRHDKERERARGTHSPTKGSMGRDKSEH